MMRSIIIIVALFSPLAVIALAAEKIKPAPAIYHNPKDAAKLQKKVKPAPKADDTVPDVPRSGSLEAEKERLRKRIAELEKMSENEWQKSKQERINFNEKWTKLPPEKRLEAIEKLREKKGGRLPEPELRPARPQSELPAKR